VDQSSPDFFWWNAGGIADHHVFPILDMLTRSGDIRDRSLKLSEIVPNFACFLAPNFFGGGPPEFLDLRSCGKVSRRLAEGARRSRGERKKTSAVIHKAQLTEVTLNSYIYSELFF